MELYIAIAMLCSNNMGNHETLECQQYYVKCSQKRINWAESLHGNLAKCILKKKTLGGNE